MERTKPLEFCCARIWNAEVEVNNRLAAHLSNHANIVRVLKDHKDRLFETSTTKTLASYSFVRLVARDAFLSAKGHFVVQ
mmetsp:Transcript_3001/g.11491  ORF Transcript_3001/g.11491 Transcript_3001/m.11491 type:complete len:80 (+) Transcript_3001:527-766(+)